ncbi:Y-box-binding protein 2, partial [Ophiophagus hannah]
METNQGEKQPGIKESFLTAGLEDPRGPFPALGKKAESQFTLTHLHPSVVSPRPFRPRPPQQPTTEGGDGKTKAAQVPADGIRPEPQRQRNRPYFQRRRQQTAAARQTATEVKGKGNWGQGGGGGAEEVRKLVAEIWRSSGEPANAASGWPHQSHLFSASH